MILFTVFCTLLITQLEGSKSVQYKDPHCAPGRTAITHLFEWKWSDIAEECERFLGPYGYCGVQISPPNENRVVTNPNRPWWERYQPVSYKLKSRSGNSYELKDMIARCNKVGVRIYADAVINHMTGVACKGHGTKGSGFDADKIIFPGVPYGPFDFNSWPQCQRRDQTIHDYSNAQEVRNCRLSGLLDLKLSSDYVRNKIAGYLNYLIELGVAGIRIDAAKHMWPRDIDAILSMTNPIKSDVFGEGKRLFVFQEVIDMGGEGIKESEYVNNGRVTNFMYGMKLGEVFRRRNPMKYLQNFGEGWGMCSGGDAVNFIDNHDNQRGHGGGGSVLTHWEARPYKLATAFMLAFSYGFPRIMSSYEYNREDDSEGPPHNSDMSIKSVTINGMSCGGRWTCEHRWRQIYNMVAFRNVAGATKMANWWAGADYQIAFSRGSKAFIALNLEEYYLDENLNTGLPGGTYCDVISGNLENGKCTGTTVNVGANGRARISISNRLADPMIAIHVGAKLGSSPFRLG